MLYNNLWFCYYGQINSLRLKSSVASKWERKHFWGTIYFAVDGTLFLCSLKLYVDTISLLRFIFWSLIVFIDNL